MDLQLTDVYMLIIASARVLDFTRINASLARRCMQGELRFSSCFIIIYRL